MNIEIKNAFLNSLVARAAYADLYKVTNSQVEASNNSSLKDSQSAMVDSMVKYFIDKFTVVDSMTTTESDYQGVLFKNKDDGELYLGNRGTQPSSLLGDIGIADVLGITLNGRAFEQIIEMILFVSNSPDILCAPKINIAGHSLGGHLTTVLRFLMDGRINHAYTYNGAGVSSGFINFAAAVAKNPTIDLALVIDCLRRTDQAWTIGDDAVLMIARLFDVVRNGAADQFGTSSVGAGKSDNLITNYETLEYPDLVNNAASKYGEKIQVNIDGSFAGSTLGHGIINLSDALTVAYVLSCLDGSLNISKINKIVESMSAEQDQDRDETIRYVLTALGKPTEAAKIDGTNEKLMEGIFGTLLGEMKLEEGVLSAKFIKISDLGIEDIMTLATQNTTNGMLMRVALIEGSSFALSDINSPNIYDNEFKEKYQCYNPETDQGITLEELHKRAELAVYADPMESLNR